MRHAAAPVVLALAVVTACAPPPRPFTESWYTPPRVLADAAAALPVTVYAFADTRPGDDKRVVLRYETNIDDPGTVHATAPVGQGVARALARGLAARGFRVTDATARDHVAETGGSPRVAITGRVAEFDARIVRASFLGGYRQHVGCRLTLEAYDAASGRRLFERTYARVAEGAMSPMEPLAFLARALADVVEQAVTVTELLRAIS